MNQIDVCGLCGQQVLPPGHVCAQHARLTIGLPCPHGSVSWLCWECMKGTHKMPGFEVPMVAPKPDRWVVKSIHHDYFVDAAFSEFPTGITFKRQMTPEWSPKQVHAMRHTERDARIIAHAHAGRPVRLVPRKGTSVADEVERQLRVKK